MQELTDDQLDGLFRKSAEEFDPAFDPAAWQAMQSRLDANDRTKPGQTSLMKNLLRWGLPLVLLLMLTGGGWYIFRDKHAATNGTVSRKEVVKERMPSTVSEPVGQSRQHAATRSLGNKPDTRSVAAADEPRQPASSIERVAGVQKADKPDGAITTPVSKVNPAGFSEPEKATNPSTSAYGQVVKVSRDNSLKANTPGAVVTIPTGTSYHRQNLRQYKAANRKPGNALINRNIAGSSATTYAIDPVSSFGQRNPVDDIKFRQSSSPAADNNTTPETNTAGPLALPALNTLTIRPAHWPKPFAFTNREVMVQPDAAQPSAAQPDTVKQVTVQKPVYQRGLSIRFAVSPDLSGIGLTNFSRPGTNVGMLLEYRLASRWSVQAGIIQSTKVYKASTSQYELPSYLASLRVPPESVNGRCNIFDIPLNLRYDVALRPRLNGLMPSRWFMSGGLTTYIMKQEDYDYNYPDGTHIYPTTPLGWHGNTGNWFNLSQLNFSVGYERALSRRLSWQVEPFLKVPLKGVGYYKINLLSTGTFFSIRYKL